MSIRILDDSGGEIASFFSDKPEADEGGFQAGLRDALLAFRCTRRPDLSMFNPGDQLMPRGPKGEASRRCDQCRHHGRQDRHRRD